MNVQYPELRIRYDRWYPFHAPYLAGKLLSTNVNKSHPLAVHGHPGHVILLFLTIPGPDVIRAEKINPCARIENIWMWNIDLRYVSISAPKLVSLHTNYCPHPPTWVHIYVSLHRTEDFIWNSKVMNKKVKMKHRRDSTRGNNYFKFLIENVLLLFLFVCINFVFLYILFVCCAFWSFFLYFFSICSFDLFHSFLCCICLLSCLFVCLLHELNVLQYDGRKSSCRS